MKIEDRIARLEKAVAYEREQRDWLRSVDWSLNGATAKSAANHHEQNIVLYEKLISGLKSRQ